MSVKKRVLGRGLDAILGKDEAPVPIAPPPAGSSVQKVPFVRLKANPWQPRKNFTDDALEELCASIRQNGILQPLVVRPAGDEYEIVAGERRWRAAQRAGLTEVPVLIRSFNDQEMLELALIENLQREDLNAIEEALAYQQLIDQFGMIQDQVADKVGKSRVAVTNSLRLLRLPGQIQEWIVERRLSAGHARALLALESDSSRLALAREIMAEGLNVRQTEQRVRRLQVAGPGSKKTGKSAIPVPGAENGDLEERLSLHLGQKVKILQQSNNQGRIEIHYASVDEFQGILEKLGVPVEQEI